MGARVPKFGVKLHLMKNTIRNIHGYDVKIVSNPWVAKFTIQMIIKGEKYVYVLFEGNKKIVSVDALLNNKITCCPLCDKPTLNVSEHGEAYDQCSGYYNEA